MSDTGDTSDSPDLEKIADLVGHSGTSVTEKVYRHQLRPVLLDGAQVLERVSRLLGSPPGRTNAPGAAAPVGPEKRACCRYLTGQSIAIKFHPPLRMMLRPS